MGLKKTLASWGFNKKAIQLDDDTLTLCIEDKPVCKVGVLGHKLNIEWLDANWGSWKELMEAGVYMELVSKGKAALQRAQELRAAGKGKGKWKA